MLLTDALLLNYKRCQRRPFLEVYGDSNQKDPERDFLIKLRQENQAQIDQFLAQQTYHQPDAPLADGQERARQTLHLMQQGVDCIYQGVLQRSGLDGWAVPQLKVPAVTLSAIPTLLIKHPGNSNFGNWYYEPVNVKLGRRPKPEYKLIAAFQAHLLALIQGRWPETSTLILRQQTSYAVRLESWIPRMEAVLSECLEMLVARSEPEVFISRQRCSLCQWQSACYAIAAQTRHLSLIPGVTPARYETLQTLGVTTVESLATVPLLQLGEPLGWEVATQLKQQAQAIWHNQAILKTAAANAHLQFLPTADVELYFDIEAEPERNLDYLLGILLIDRRTNQEVFYPFIAENPDEEERIWQQFFQLVSSYPQAPIFHFSDYEAETIKRLAKLYHTPPAAVKSLLGRLVDVHRQVTSWVTLPVESYSLKAIAGWLGFQWRDRGVSGEQCVCWYDQWLKTGDRALLEAILRYNEDDCRATYHLKDWLLDFLASCDRDQPAVSLP